MFLLCDNTMSQGFKKYSIQMYALSFYVVFCVFYLISMELSRDRTADGVRTPILSIKIVDDQHIISYTE